MEYLVLLKRPTRARESIIIFLNSGIQLQKADNQSKCKTKDREQINK